MSEDVPTISEHFRSYLKLFWQLSNMLKTFDSVIKRRLLEYFFLGGGGELNRVFVVNVLKNNSSGFVSQA